MTFNRAEIRDNLSLLYLQATHTDVTLGTDWYPAAHRIVAEWASHYRFSDATVASVIAALSPQLEWSRNLITADDVLAQRPVSVGGALHANIDKARRILANAAQSPADYFPCGPKVQHFAQNLMGRMDYVTVDGHCSQAAVNRPDSQIGLKWPAYTTLALCYGDVARAVGRSPAEFQAITWHVWKRLYPRTRKLAIRRGAAPSGHAYYHARNQIGV